MRRNEFYSDDDFARKHESHPIWRTVYQSITDFQYMEPTHQTAKWLQLAGVDRHLLLHHSHQSQKWIKVDDKLRRGVWGDVVVEFMSNAEAKKPGWACKPELLTDAVCYVVPEAGWGAVIPHKPLCNAWMEYGERWKQEFGVKSAENKHYTTQFVPVSHDELSRCVAGFRVVKFDAFKLE